MCLVCLPFGTWKLGQKIVISESRRNCGHRPCGNWQTLPSNQKTCLVFKPMLHFNRARMSASNRDKDGLINNLLKRTF